PGEPRAESGRLEREARGAGARDSRPVAGDLVSSEGLRPSARPLHALSRAASPARSVAASGGRVAHALSLVRVRFMRYLLLVKPAIGAAVLLGLWTTG